MRIMRYTAPFFLAVWFCAPLLMAAVHLAFFKMMK
jgi:hypothetical protein